MEWDLYLNSVDFSKFDNNLWSHKRYLLSDLLKKNEEKLLPGKSDIVIIGVEEDRNAIKKGSSDSPNAIRKYLYGLNRISSKFKIRDLGNIKVGKSVNDTYFALREVCRELMKRKTTIVILGGSQDLIRGISMAFEKEPFRLVTIDPMLDFRRGEKTINSDNYLNSILNKKNKGNSTVILGYQNYFTDREELDYALSVNIQTRRLGQLRYDMQEIEPFFRETDMVGFDLNSIRQTEAPGQYFQSPNGLYPEEACQMIHYAGMGNDVKVAGFFNLIPELDPTDLSSKLMAQIVWHFLEGFYLRIPEDPAVKTCGFTEYNVSMDDIDFILSFYKSDKTGRWWMKIANPGKEEDIFIPCSQKDYEQSCRNEIPDRLLRAVRV